MTADVEADGRVDGAAETGPTGPMGPMGAGYRATRKRQWELNHNVATAAGAGG